MSRCSVCRICLANKIYYVLASQSLSTNYLSMKSLAICNVCKQWNVCVSGRISLSVFETKSKAALPNCIQAQRCFELKAVSACTRGHDQNANMLVFPQMMLGIVQQFILEM